MICMFSKSNEMYFGDHMILLNISLIINSTSNVHVAYPIFSEIQDTRLWMLKVKFSFGDCFFIWKLYAQRSHHTNNRFWMSFVFFLLINEKSRGGGPPRLRGTPEIFDYILHYSIQRVNKVLRLSKLYLIRKSRLCSFWWGIIRITLTPY